MKFNWTTVSEISDDNGHHVTLVAQVPGGQLINVVVYGKSPTYEAIPVATSLVFIPIKKIGDI